MCGLGCVSGYGPVVAVIGQRGDPGRPVLPFGAGFSAGWCSSVQDSVGSGERGVRGVWEVSPRPGLRHGSLLLSDPRAQVRTERVRGRSRRMRTYLRREDCVSL